MKLSFSASFFSSSQAAFLMVMALGLCVFSGCGASEATSQNAAPFAQQAIAIQRKPFGEPLTETEVEVFLAILRQLPDGQSPHFAESELPSLEIRADLPIQIEHLRKAMRESLQPRRQGAHWNSQSSLKNAFERMAVDPEAFAEMVLRVSCAWSAVTISAETRSVAIRHRIEQQVAELTRRLQTLSESQWDANQKRMVLEELVVLSEFLKLIELVPDESLAVVARYQTELRKVLPESNLNPQVSREQPQRSKIQQVSWESR